MTSPTPVDSGGDSHGAHGPKPHHKGGELHGYGKGFGAFLWSIAMQEGNGYDLVNPSSGALGRYQVMPANVPEWTLKALGHSLTATEYLNNPHAQDKTVIYILGHYFKHMGAQRAAATWYSGNPDRWNDHSPVNNGPSVAEYVHSVVTRMSNAPHKLHLADGKVPIHEVGMGGTGGGGGGGNSSHVIDAGSADVPVGHLSHNAIVEGLNSMGFASQLIHSNKSLEQAFREIVRKQIPVDTNAGAARARAIFENTDWWANHTKSQREFDQLKYSDPSTWKKMIGDTRASLVAQAQQLGLGLDPKQLDHLATMVTRNGLTQEEQNAVLAHHFTFNPDQGYKGTIGQAIDSIHQQAAAYYVPISDQRIQHLTRQVISGQMDPNSLTDYFRQQAASMFPYLEKQLQNHTVADIADPYMQAMANTLELDPAGIKARDPMVMKALQSKDANGELGLMPLWQFQNHLYSDPRWLQTDNAHQSLVGTTSQLLQEFGLEA